MRRRSFLPEVQGLRAVAVLLVVLYHFWPLRLPGGYVGVDVFFVISGYLITSHLYREVQQKGRISLGAFYGRRVRRLLPASFLVLLVTAVAGFLILPVNRWVATATEILASTFYVQNWALAARAVEYSALADAPSPVQHFWSLSVEEQFYLGWPPLLLVLVLLARRWPGSRDRVLLGGIALVSVLSLAWSVHLTAANPAAAYFVTPTRIWELGAGAVLALVLARLGDNGAAAPGRGAAIVLRWAGLAAILWAALTYSAATPFPGYLALLPVLGTVAVIAAGDTGNRDPLSPLVHWRPVQFLGDVSYSLYLWHWPVVVLAPVALARPLTTVDKVVLIAVCIGLAAATRSLVEVPGMRWRRFALPRFTVLLTVVGMLLVSGVAGAQWYEVGRRQAAAESLVRDTMADPCFGAASLAEGADDCRDDAFDAPAWVTPVPEEAPWFRDEACIGVQEPMPLVRCTFGDGPPTRRVALVGDSHAEHWRGALHRIAREQNWVIDEYLRGGCPVTDVRVLTFRSKPGDPDGCRAWGARVDEVLRSDPPDAVFTSAWVTAVTFEGPEDSVTNGARGLARVWDGWGATGTQVFVFRDVPETGARHIPECLAMHPGEPLECARPRAEAVAPDALTRAAELTTSDRVEFLDFSDYFCDDTTCYAAVGDAMTYYDDDHMTGLYSWSLGPYVDERLAPLWD